MKTKKIYINLNNLPLSSLHPILKNLYKKLEKEYKVIYLNKKENNKNKEIPKIQKRRWLNKIIFNIKWFLNNFIPRLNIIKKQLNWPILTANQFLLTKNDYYIVTSSLIQFSGLKTKPLYNKVFQYFFKKFLLQRNLKKIIFYSKTSYNEFIYYCEKELKLHKNKFLNKLDIFYPYLKDDNIISNEDLIEKFNDLWKIKFLFIARDFLTKWWKELINALKLIDSKIYKEKFEITIISDIPKKFKLELEKLIKEKWFKINIYWIDFTQEELENKFYKTHHILFHLTRADLFWMVSLESKKNGLAIITTKQYLNYPELFKDGEALFINIKEKYNWNNWLPIIDYQTVWHIEDNVLDVVQVKEKILYCLDNPQKILELARNNLNSLSRFKNKDKILKNLFS